MGINLTNFLSSKTKNRKMSEFQDLDHIDGVSIATTCAHLFIIAIDFIIEEGTNILPILKNFFDLCVEAPQYLSFGTFMPPILSNSFLVFICLKK